MLIIDPLAEWHDGPENDNQHMHRVMADARDFAREADLAVVIAHHPAKADGLVTMATIRGASSTGGAARAIFALNQVGPAEAKELGIAETDHDDIICLSAEKLSYQPGFGAPIYLRRSSVKIGDASAPVLEMVRLDPAKMPFDKALSKGKRRA